MAFAGNPGGATPLRLKSGFLNGLKVEGSLSLLASCANMWIVLSSDHRFKWSGLRSTDGAVVSGWNCDKKELYGDGDGKSASCASKGDYDISISTSGGKISFSDSKGCSTLTTGNPFTETDTLYVYVGANPDPKENKAGSRFTSVRVWGSLSNASVLEVEPDPEAPLLQDSLQVRATGCSLMAPVS